VAELAPADHLSGHPFQPLRLAFDLLKPGEHHYELYIVYAVDFSVAGVD
jgi:hypothetical protein